MDEQQIQAVIAFLDEQIVGLELHYTARNSYPFYHMIQLKNYRRVLQKELTAFKAVNEMDEQTREEIAYHALTGE